MSAGDSDRVATEEGAGKVAMGSRGGGSREAGRAGGREAGPIRERERVEAERQRVAGRGRGRGREMHRGGARMPCACAACTGLTRNCRVYF